MTRCRSGSLRTGLTAALVWILVLPGILAQPDDFQSLAQRGAEARSGGRLTEAADLYRSALELNPQWQQGWWYLGTVLYDLERYPEAREVFEEMIRRWPNHGLALGLLGLCQFQTGDYEQALLNLQEARVYGLGDNPGLLRLFRFHGALLLNRLGQFEAAYEALKGFAYEDVRSPGVLDAFGLSLLRMPFLPDEIPAEEREAVQLAGRAAFESESGNRDGAEALYLELINRFPDLANVHYAYGVYLLRNRQDEALEQFKKELEGSPGHVEALLQIAFEYIHRGAFDQARPYAEQAVKLVPNSFSAHNALGQVMLESDDLEGAIRELELAVELGPRNPESRYALSRAYQKAGRREDALRERQEFKRLNDMKTEAEEFFQKTPSSMTQEPKRPE